MKKIAVLPSLLTLGNAFCGFLAIAYTADALFYFQLGGGTDSAIFYSRLHAAAWLIFGAMVFDALDGKVARMAELTSDFGGQLDSLCDAISFGVAPAFLAKVLVDFETIAEGLKPHPKFLFAAAALFAICAILRLARFNVENKHGDDYHTHFKGLPTPAAAGVIASIVLLYLGFGESKIAQWLVGTMPGFEPKQIAVALRYILPFLLPILGLLMVSRVRYVHFTNYVISERRSFAVLIQVILVILIAIVEPELALAIFFIGFATSGMFLWVRDVALGKSQNQNVADEEEATP